MNRLFHRVMACAVFAFSGAAHSATQTLHLGDWVEADRVTSEFGEVSVTQLSHLRGGLAFEFSPLLIAALNTAKASLGEEGPAELQAGYSSSTSSTGVVTTRLRSAELAAPITSLTGEFGGGQALIEQVTSVGGMTLSTIKNGATNGAGFLTISNLQLDLARGAVLADINGGNGVGSQRGFHLWSYTAVTGPTRYAAPVPGAAPDPFFGLEVDVSNGFTGLFASQQSLDTIAQALNLNAIGRTALGFANDPLRGQGEGFGSLTLDFSILMNRPVSVSLAVPEPSSSAMLAVGGLCVAWFARRRQAAQPSA